MDEVLLLVHRIPYPPNKGDKLRSFNLLKALSARYRVHLGTFVDDPHDWEHTAYLRSLCAETYFARLNPMATRLRSLGALGSGEALSVRYYRDEGLARWVDAILRQYDVKRLVAFSSPVAQYLLRFTDANRVADMVDVDSAKWEQYASNVRWPVSWLYRREGRTLLKFERSIAARFAATVFVSEAEAALFRRLSGCAPERIHSIGNGVDIDYFSPTHIYPDPYAGARRILAFTGAMDYWPNVDAVQWFATDIFPRIRRAWPDARFVIVGARPSRAVVRLGALEGVTVTGTVPDVRPFIAHATAVVAPLRIARGVQNKVLEGMAMARTVVASPDAAEGIDVRRGTDVLVASTPEEYVDALTSVFEGKCDLGSNARATILRSYTWERSMERMTSLLDPNTDEHESTARLVGASGRR